MLTQILRLAMLTLSLLLLSQMARAQDATVDVPSRIAAMGEANLRELTQIVTDLASTGDSAVVPVLTALGDGNLYLDETSGRVVIQNGSTITDPLTGEAVDLGGEADLSRIRVNNGLRRNIAAALSGIDVKKVTFWCYVNMGFLAGVAGVVYSARMNGAQPSAGNMFELDAIAACFIGGASTTGGIGRLSGALIGGLIMAVMSNGMQLMGASTSTQQIVKGAVLLLAVAFDVWNKQRASA